MTENKNADETAVIPSSPMLQSALFYAQLGWAVLQIYPLSGNPDHPCSCNKTKCDNAGKHPRTYDWTNEATTDPVIISEWWNEHPTDGIGIATGSKSGIFVIDIDPRHGGEDTWNTLTAEYGQIPNTPESITGSGGGHIIFKNPDTCDIKNDSKGKYFGAGVDVRGEGGYIVAPPSLHKNGNHYEWELSSDPANVKVADAPEWIISKLNNPQQPQIDFDKDTDNEPQTNNDNRDSGIISDGNRNSTLTSMAGTMRRKGMTQQAIEVALLAENHSSCNPPLPDDEVKTIAKSVSRYAPGEAFNPIDIIEPNDPNIIHIREIRDKRMNLRNSFYNKSPDHIKTLTQLFYTLNPILPPSAHYFTAINLACAIIGKRIIARNFGRDYYCNQWLVVLAPTSTNKSAIMTTEAILDDIIYSQVDTAPVALLSNRFTRSYAYSEMGGSIKMDKWRAMSETEKILMKHEIKETCQKSKAKLIISDEFAHTFADLLRSGGKSNDRDLGFILQLAESMAKIETPTNTDGYRAIFDCCLSFIGYAQPDMWHTQFGARANLESGLIGRFFVANIDDYLLDIQPLPITPEQCKHQIKATLEAMIAKVESVPDKTICDFVPGGGNRGSTNDLPREAYNNIMAVETFKIFQNSGLVPFMDDNDEPGRIGGKIMVQAIKYCVMDRLFSQDIKQGQDLVDYDTLRRYMMLLMLNSIKLFTCGNAQTEIDLIEDKIRAEVIYKPQSVRDIQRLGLKEGGFLIRSERIKDILEGMAERDLIVINKAARRDSWRIRASVKSVNGKLKSE